MGSCGSFSFHPSPAPLACITRSNRLPTEPGEACFASDGVTFASVTATDVRVTASRMREHLFFFAFFLNRLVVACSGGRFATLL